MGRRGGTGAAGRIGKPLDDELAEFYTDFVKNQVFAFLQPELVAGVLPNYIYLIQDFRLKMTFGGDMSLANYWDEWILGILFKNGSRRTFAVYKIF